MTRGKAYCGICGGYLAGSNMIDLDDSRQLSVIIMMHTIDNHWDLIQRLRATTNDPEKRAKLVDELAREQGERHRAATS